MNLEPYKEYLIARRTEISLAQGNQNRLKAELKALQGSATTLSEALEIMNIVGVLSQKEYKEVIEELVTYGVQYIFGDNHRFIVESGVSRNKPEMRMYIEIDGDRFTFKEDQGGGIMDVVSFILRVVCWAIDYRRTRPLLIFDEPFKYLHFFTEGQQTKIGEMINRLSEMLGLQIIIITVEQAIVGIMDKSYLVTKKNKVSVVKEVESKTAISQLIEG